MSESEGCAFLVLFFTSLVSSPRYGDHYLEPLDGEEVLEISLGKMTTNSRRSLRLASEEQSTGEEHNRIRGIGGGEKGEKENGEETRDEEEEEGDDEGWFDAPTIPSKTTKSTTTRTEKNKEERWSSKNVSNTTASNSYKQGEVKQDVEGKDSEWWNPFDDDASKQSSGKNNSNSNVKENGKTASDQQIGSLAELKAMVGTE